METETANITEARDAEEAPGLPPFLQGLDGLIDARAVSKLARLGEDYTETTITLRTLDGASETRRIGPAPLSNFEPDFIQTTIEATGGGRVSVEVTAPGARPWRFLLELPEADPEPARLAPVPAAPAPAASPELAALVSQLAASQAQLQAQVSRMLDRLDARDAMPKQDDDAELLAAVRDVKRELMNQTLAAIKGEDTRGRARIKEYLSEFREVVKDLAGVKTDIDATAAVLGGGASSAPGKPEPSAVELAEQAAGALERIAQGPVGSRLLNRFFPGPAEPTQPLLTDKSTPGEVEAIYG